MVFVNFWLFLLFAPSIYVSHWWGRIDQFFSPPAPQGAACPWPKTDTTDGPQRRGPVWDTNRSAVGTIIHGWLFCSFVWCLSIYQMLLIVELYYIYIYIYVVVCVLVVYFQSVSCRPSIRVFHKWSCRWCECVGFPCYGINSTCTWFYTISVVYHIISTEMHWKTISSISSVNPHIRRSVPGHHMSCPCQPIRSLWQVLFVVFSPCGTRLASCSRDLQTVGVGRFHRVQFHCRVGKFGTVHSPGVRKWQLLCLKNQAASAWQCLDFCMKLEPELNIKGYQRQDSCRCSMNLLQIYGSTPVLVSFTCPELGSHRVTPMFCLQIVFKVSYHHDDDMDRLVLGIGFDCFSSKPKQIYRVSGLMFGTFASIRTCSLFVTML